MLRGPLPAVKPIVRDALLLVAALIVATCIVSGAAPLIRSAKQMQQASAADTLQPAAIAPGKLSPSLKARLERRAVKRRNVAAASTGVVGAKAIKPTAPTAPASDETIASNIKRPGATPAPKGAAPGDDDRPTSTPKPGGSQTPAGGGEDPVATPAAIPVNVNGEGGWAFSGTNAEGKQVRLVNGALQLPGGFDRTTLQGGIGVAMAVKNRPLSELSAISYRFEVARRSGADEPTVHVTVVGAVPGVDSKLDNGQTNFVYRPSSNGLAGARSASVDALAAGNRWYATGNVSGGPGSEAAPISLQELAARNPSARITQIAIDNGGASGDGTTLSDATSIAIDDVAVGLFGRVDRFDFHT